MEVSFLYKTDLCVFTRKVVSGGCNCQVQDHPIKIWPTFQQAFTHANILKYFNQTMKFKLQHTGYLIPQSGTQVASNILTKRSCNDKQVLNIFTQCMNVFSFFFAMMSIILVWIFRLSCVSCENVNFYGQRSEAE